jgi:hypothetical protein
VSEPAVPVDANVVRPKIDRPILLELRHQNNPDVHDFLIRRDATADQQTKQHFSAASARGR